MASRDVGACGTPYVFLLGEKLEKIHDVSGASRRQYSDLCVGRYQYDTAANSISPRFPIQSTYGNGQHRWQTGVATA